RRSLGRGRERACPAARAPRRLGTILASCEASVKRLGVLARSSWWLPAGRSPGAASGLGAGAVPAGSGAGAVPAGRSRATALHVGFTRTWGHMRTERSGRLRPPWATTRLPRGHGGDDASDRHCRHPFVG